MERRLLKGKNSPGKGPRMVMRARQRMSRRMIIAASSIFIVVATAGLVIYFQFARVEKTLASPIAGDYRSSSSGNWNATTTWQTYNGTSWVAASASPTEWSGATEIQSGHAVTVTASVTVDQVTVDAGGTLIITTGKLSLNHAISPDLKISGTLNENNNLELLANATMLIAGVGTIGNGSTITADAGSTITVSGTFIKSGGTVPTDAGTWIIASGGTYQHDDNGTKIPYATWNTNSTCNVTGVLNTQPNQLDQSFYNFIWNCPSQTSKESLGDNLTTINGDFTLVSTGTGSVRLTTNGTGPLTIAGSYYHQGGTLYISGSGNWTVNVGGNYSQTGGTLAMTDATNGTGKGNPTMNITGNFSISGGTFDMNQYTGNTAGLGIGTLNLSGNFTQTAGTITQTGTGTAGYGDVYFKNAGTQAFSKAGGTISNNVNFTVNSGATLDMETNILTGAGNFTLSSGSGIIIGSPSGITSSGASGNVQVTGTRSYSTGATYTFSGSAGQNTGNGFPASASNYIINNSAGVTLTSDLIVSGTLTMTNGIISTGSHTVKVTNASTTAITGYSSTSYINGNLDRSVNSSGSYDFPIGTSANYELINITLSSTSGFSDILGSFTNSNPISALLPLLGLLVNGNTITDMLNYGYWTLTPNSTITGGSYSVTLNERGHTNSASSASAYCVLKRHDGLSSWASVGTHNSNTQSESGGVATAVRSAITSFSQYGIGSGSGGSLPIELLSFAAKFNSDHVDLSWATAIEINNDYFTIERSQDGTNFKEVLRKPGAGNSNKEIDYTAIDDAPLHGISYYRMKQTDYNGHFVDFPAQAVEYGNAKGDQTMTIKTAGPNPFTDHFNINYSIEQQGEVEIQISNSSGQLVYRETINADKGFNTYSYNDVKGLPPGIYIVNMICNGEAVTQKMIKH